ncbi:alkaline phosphatase family protein [Cumulibacter manganitolerans]|uniref:alkaline phosphatase family protein n=1 Tax=Cumulibacter manganitolerans TaxID=1884992 RepID=UPI001296322E|nr:alkaline phosphatase family protein [Cumulibacter manganitolerans]
MTAFLPSYGDRSLAEVMPAVLRALEVPSFAGASALPIPPARAVAVLLVDGLGSELLAAHAGDAPFLSSVRDLGPLTAGFPSSTSISLTSLGTGRPPGAHGVLGIAMRADDGTMIDTLRWARHGVDQHVDLRDTVVPETVQAQPTVWEIAAGAGIATSIVGPRAFRRSGLSRAALRGGDYRGAVALGDLVAEVAAGVGGSGRRLCYAYHADLDTLGHLHGPGSVPWRNQLRLIDRLAVMIAESLPRDGQLLITGDHGMVAVEERIDADLVPELQDGVEALGGDPRARHVYVRDGAADDVLAAWRETLGPHAWVVSREEAIGNGWFGPVDDAVRARIGDVVAALAGRSAVVRSRAEPMLSRLVGQHGSLTTAEQQVPLLFATAG